MRKFYVLILFYLLSHTIFAQDIDSLKIIFNNTKKTNDFICFDVAENIVDYYSFFLPDSALKYCNEIIRYAEKFNNIEKKVEFLNTKGKIFEIKDDYYNAVSNYFEAVEAINYKENSRLYALSLMNLSSALTEMGFNLDYAKKYLIQSQKIFKNLNDDEGQAKCYFIISFLYAKENNKDSSFFNINKSLTLCNSTQNEKLKAENFYYFSKIYSESKEYLKAATYIKKSISLSRQTKQEPYYMNILADIYLQTGFYSAAENIYNNTELLFIEHNNYVSLCDVYLDLSKLYLLQKNFELAISFSQEALKIAKELNLLHFQQEIYYTLSMIYSENQNVDLALHSYKKYSLLRDSLFSQKTQNEAELLYKNYIMQLKLQDQQILFNQKEYQVLKNKQQKLLIYILAFIGISLVVFLIILYRLYIQRKSNEKRLKQLTEITLDGIVIHDGNLVVEVNDKFCEISGYQRNEIVGEHIFKLLSKKSQEEVSKRANIKKILYYNLEFVKKNGETFIGEVLSKPMILNSKNVKIVSIRDLSELKNIKQELQDTTVKFQALIETSPDGVVITDKDGVITYISPAFANIFNNKNGNKIISKKLSDFVSPLYKNKVETDIRNIINGDFWGVTEYTSEQENGKTIYLECNGNALKTTNNNVTGVFFIVRDVTERKLNENALIESESRFKGLFNSSKDAIVIQNNKMRIVDLNPQVSELFGYSFDELINTDFRELLPINNRKVNLRNYINSDVHFETFAYTKTSKKLYIQISVSELFFCNDNYFLLTIRDLSLLKIQENNLRQIAVKLKASNAAKDKMFSIIAHDLRGPIGNLKSMIEYIAENPTEFDIKEIIEIIYTLRDSSANTYELLENLLSWAKSQQDLLEYNPDIYNLNEIIVNSIELVLQGAKNKNISIEFHNEDNAEIICDENMIKAVFRNLLSNSIKFSNPNSKINVDYSINEQWITVKIEDFGVGIAPENIQKIFDDTKYFTTYGTNNEKGSGLGLKLCNEFIKRNKGKIWVESEINKGSKFYFTLKKSN